jgi:cytochrome c553
MKAAACAACHGPQGLSLVPDAPNLAGQPPLYVAAQLKAYRDGTRKHEVMSLMAKTLSDADIDDLAAWFGSLKVQVQGSN